MVSHIKMNRTIISNCDKRGYKRGKGTELLKTIDDIEYELGIVKKSIKEINSRKKVYNKQLRQYIAYMKVLEKKNKYTFKYIESEEINEYRSKRK